MKGDMVWSFNEVCMPLVGWLDLAVAIYSCECIVIFKVAHTHAFGRVIWLGSYDADVLLSGCFACLMRCEDSSR